CAAVIRQAMTSVGQTSTNGVLFQVPDIGVRRRNAQRHVSVVGESLKLKQGGWALFKANRNVRRAVFLGMLLQAMQQFTGMNIIM
ncbi:MFS transporter, partial [Salmonella enterica subsp. enterica serovar Agona]|nr:MFS transporter [Salmonella enterica subsp. enterica serovar Agona]